MGLDRSQVFESPGSFSVAKPRTVSPSAERRPTGPLTAVLRAFPRRREGRKRAVPPRADAALANVTTAPRDPPC